MYITAILRTARESPHRLASTYDVHLQLTPCHMLDPDAGFLQLHIHPNEHNRSIQSQVIEFLPGQAAELAVAINKAITELEPPKRYRHPAEGGSPP